MKKIIAKWVDATSPDISTNPLKIKEIYIKEPINEVGRNHIEEIFSRMSEEDYEDAKDDIEDIHALRRGVYHIADGNCALYVLVDDYPNY